MKDTKIEWCDHTFNPWEGCTKVSPGCANCYAETRNARWNGGTAPNWGPGAPRRRTSAANWREPVKWNREDERARVSALHSWPAGKPMPWTRPRVFCSSLADWLDDEVPAEWLIGLLELIHETRQLDWLLLTKRPENFMPRMQAALATYKARVYMQLGCQIANWIAGIKWPNVWVGTTVEDQQRADERIPHLLRIPATVRFLSCEPLLGPVQLAPRWIGSQLEFEDTPWNYVDWVIAGGESGLKARPMHEAWARSLRDQCAAAGVPFMFKQWGEWLPVQQVVDTEIDPDDWQQMPVHHWPQYVGVLSRRCGKKRAGRLLDGRKHNEYPQ